MSKTTDYVIETMNENNIKEIEIQLDKIAKRKLIKKYNLIQSHGGGIIKKIKNN